MRVDELLLELQDMVNNAKAIPMSKDKKVILSGDRIFDIIDEIEDNMPSEVRQAKDVVADREQILAEARRNKDEIIRQAEERRKIMISQHEIVKAAEAQAKEILAAAKKKSMEMQKATNDYVDNTMREAEECLIKKASSIKKTRQAFKDHTKASKEN